MGDPGIIAINRFNYRLLLIYNHAILIKGLYVIITRTFHTGCVIRAKLKETRLESSLDDVIMILQDLELSVVGRNRRRVINAIFGLAVHHEVIVTSEGIDKDPALGVHATATHDQGVGAVADALEIDDDRGHFACVRLSPVVGMQNPGSGYSVPRQP